MLIICNVYNDTNTNTNNVNIFYVEDGAKIPLIIDRNRGGIILMIIIS